LNLFRSLLPALLLATGAAHAAEPAFGFQGALALPTGDLSDMAGLGLQAGGHARWDFGRGHGIMARADATFYGSKHGVTTSSLAAAGDYTYHLDQNRRGLYFLAGISFINYSHSWNGVSNSNNGLGFDIGAGFDLDKHLGLQARYTSHNLDSIGYGSLNLGVTYTF
jgi:hypothetical protein